MQVSRPAAKKQSEKRAQLPKTSPAQQHWSLKKRYWRRKWAGKRVLSRNMRAPREIKHRKAQDRANDFKAPPVNKHR